MCYGLCYWKNHKRIEGKEENYAERTGGKDLRQRQNCFKMGDEQRSSGYRNY